MSWADGKDRDMWPGRCTATIRHRWASAGGQGVTWVFGRAASDTEWVSAEETVRCMLNDGHRGKHMYREPPVPGFPHDERHHEWSE